MNEGWYENGNGRTLIPVPWDGGSNRDLGSEKRVCEGVGHWLFPMQQRSLDEWMRWVKLPWFVTCAICTEGSPVYDAWIHAFSDPYLKWLRLTVVAEMRMI